MTELDEKLKRLATENWEEFIRIVGEDSILIGKMRLLKMEGKTYRQISIKLNVTENKIRYATRPLKINGDNKQG